jgi:O-antigen biosynthesis protein
MLHPIKIVDIELSQPLSSFDGLEGYMGLQGLVRLYGTPLGYVKAPVSQGCCSADLLGSLILKKHSKKIIRWCLKNGLASPMRASTLDLCALAQLPPVDLLEDSQDALPLVSVAVCTRDRPDDIKRCVEALLTLDYPRLEILVIDNAATTSKTQDLIEATYPQIRYVPEPRPGLDWARNRAVLEARGDIIAYTDDDVVVDAGWVKGLVQPFIENPEVMAVTGLVVPHALETEAQVLFEFYGGFGRGFKRREYQSKLGQPIPWNWLGAGQFGTGANMAYRRCVFGKIGYFDPALDVGTPTNGCGDLEMFIRVLQSGHSLVYEPRALVRHCHRQGYAQLKRQLSFNGSVFALWGRVAQLYPQLRLSCLKITVFWMLMWNVRRWLINYSHRTQFPGDLITAELKGALASFGSYKKAKRQAIAIEKQFGPQVKSQPGYAAASSRQMPDENNAQIQHPIQYSTEAQASSNLDLQRPASESIAVRQLELSQPICALSGLERYSQVQLFVTWHNSPIGSLTYSNNHRDVAVPTLARLLVNSFGRRLLDPERRMPLKQVKANAVDAIATHFGLSTGATPASLNSDVSVSVVIATFDRPDDLRNCLMHLQQQQTERKVEIVVVDNHPSSGLTPPVVADFPEVVLVKEPRQGLAYGRNAGFVASSGDILIATDDDVTMPPNWIETLVQPFARADVMIVTGNVLPLELENRYQQAFETYGGLGRGFKPKEITGDWYDASSYIACATWSLGATANAAFRASIFSHLEIGLMDECLGPGMPSGVGEDTYLFYKTIKAGYTLIYEPKSYVWHKHRNTEAALKKQLYAYSKGHVSYNLTTWLRDKDWRGLVQILFYLPYYHLERIKDCLLGRSRYPFSLIWVEIKGNLAGPWSLWRSRRRVAKEGRSGPFVRRSSMSVENSTVITEEMSVQSVNPQSVNPQSANSQSVMITASTESH